MQSTVCCPACPAQLSSASWPACNDKSPSQPVLIGGPQGLYKGEEGGDWLCFTENIITPLNAGGQTEIPRPRNGDDHPGWEYMTWLTEALSPIWKPNCEAKNKEEKEKWLQFVWWFFFFSTDQSTQYQPFYLLHFLQIHKSTTYSLYLYMICMFQLSFMSNGSSGWLC